MKIGISSFTVIILLFIGTTLFSIGNVTSGENEINDASLQFLIFEEWERSSSAAMNQGSNLVLSITTNVSVYIEVFFQGYAFIPEVPPKSLIYDNYLDQKEKLQWKINSSGRVDIKLSYKPSPSLDPNITGNLSGKTSFRLFKISNPNDFLSSLIRIIVVATLIWAAFEITMYYIKMKFLHSWFGDDLAKPDTKNVHLQHVPLTEGSPNKNGSFKIFLELRHYLNRYNFRNVILVLGLVKIFSSNVTKTPSESQLHVTDFVFLIGLQGYLLLLVGNLFLVLYFYRIDRSVFYDWTYPSVRTSLYRINLLSIILVQLIVNYVLNGLLGIIRYYFILQTDFPIFQYYKFLSYLFLINLFQILVIMFIFFLIKKIPETIGISIFSFISSELLLADSSEHYYPLLSNTLSLFLQDHITQRVFLSSIIIFQILSYFITQRMYYNLEVV